MVCYLYGQIESLTDQLTLNYTDAPFHPAVRALRSQSLFERSIANHFYNKKVSDCSRLSIASGCFD